MNPEKPTKTTGSWFNWWPGPVVTSEALLVVTVVGFVALLLGIVGAILFTTGSPYAGVFCLVGAVGVAGIAVRRLRSVLTGGSSTV